MEYTDDIKALYQKIEAKIAELEAEIDASDMTLEESHAAQKELMDIYSTMGQANGPEVTDALRALINQLSKDSRHSAVHTELVLLYTTLDTDLMHCPKRYVVTDSELVSPAGFHPDERVFIQTKVAYHVDDLSELPDDHANLLAHDLEEGAA